MKKIIFSEDQIKTIICLYNNEYLSARTIGSKFNVDSGVIKRILTQNDTTLRKPGRIFLGGVKESNKRYSAKPIVKERKKKIHANWSAKNREHLKEYHKNYQKENKDHIKKVKREYEKTRKSKDPVYKLIGNFRTAIYIVLKENNMTKYGHYFDALGYTPMDLVNHLSSQLNDGMTWENYGEWHVDHKIPIASFKFHHMNDPEFKKCWSLENLQPMWGTENIKKSNHIL